MRNPTLLCCLLAGVLTACGGSGAAAQTDAAKTAGALTGKDTAGGDQNPQCRLFTPAELAKYVGLPLKAGGTAAMGTACQWLSTSGEGSAMIQAAPAGYHEPHKGAQGFRKVPDVGSQGFVEMSMGGWNAGAIDGAQTVVVSLLGPAASDANAIALLKETLARRHK